MIKHLFEARQIKGGIRLTQLVLEKQQDKNDLRGDGRLLGPSRRARDLLLEMTCSLQELIQSSIECTQAER